MSENCPSYKQKLENWKTSLQRVEALRDKFQETGDLRLKDEFEKLKQELEINKKIFFNFAYEGHLVTDPLVMIRTRINFDVEQAAENLVLGENTPWETIEVLSKIPDLATDLTNIKQEYKDRIEYWRGSLKDFSQRVFYPRLQTIRGYLNVKKAEIFSASSLKTIKWRLYAHNANAFFVPKLEEMEEIHLTKKNFSEFWEGKRLFKFWYRKGSFDWGRAYNEGRLVIDEKIRDKVMWL